MLSSLLVSPKAKDADSGTYMRLEGFQVVLTSQIDGQNLNSISFNLGKDTSHLVDLLVNDRNLIKIF